MKVGPYCHLKLTPLNFIVNLKRKNSFQTLVLRCTFLGGEVTGYPLRDAERKSTQVMSFCVYGDQATASYPHIGRTKVIRIVLYRTLGSSAIHLRSCLLSFSLPQSVWTS